MIRSMTAFGASRLESDQGAVAVEIRSVNNRYLDLTLRLPDELRFVEADIRERVSRHALRGKVEVRVSCTHATRAALAPLDGAALEALARQLAEARRILPDVPGPTLGELPRMETLHDGLEPEIWQPLCEGACAQALEAFSAAREREGARLAQAMLGMAQEIGTIVADVDRDLPGLVEQYQQRVAQRLEEALRAVSPDGFALISGAELTARIAQEASLFGLRVDVAEEITRLRSHLQELHDILAAPPTAARRGNGKRLDFLFQEMNREANTLGSKAATLSITRAAIDLKLLIEQMREQAQNIE